MRRREKILGARFSRVGGGPRRDGEVGFVKRAKKN